MIVRRLIAGQVWLSRQVDRLLLTAFRLDGHLRFTEEVVPVYLRPNMCIYDMGGGKRPYLTPGAKQELGARVIGIDIDPDELARAPAGSYDQAIPFDMATYRGHQDADLIICQAVLEHVRDMDGAVEALATTLRPGGTALLFAPCRNALFARLNLLLPEQVKRVLLFTLYPRMRTYQGFPSFYRDCTPSALSRHARRHGLEVIEVRTYWMSAYFHAFFPAYIVWRLWLIAARSLGKRDFCETFALVLRKPSDSASPGPAS